MKLNPCPKCGSEQINIENHPSAEIAGTMNFSIWVECIACGYECESISVDEELSREEIDLLTFQAWNSLVDTL